jgi:hypothetical protein
MTAKEILWTCPECGRCNTDTRRHFILCVHCGKTYDTMPEELVAEEMKTK